MKRKLVVCCVVFLAGCKTAEKTESSGKHDDQGGSVAQPTPGWLELYDLSLHYDVEAVVPKGLYIKGEIGTNDNFVPTSGIVGDPKAHRPTTAISRGWLELNGLRFHQMHESVAPIEPYIKGARDEAGHFFPDKPYTIVGGPE